eukprot:8767222-Pyramimonas_sp.AAC.1
MTTWGNWERPPRPLQGCFHRVDVVGYLGPLHSRRRPLGWQPRGPQPALCCARRSRSGLRHEAGQPPTVQIPHGRPRPGRDWFHRGARPRP